MNGDRERRAKELFADALERADPAEREKFLAQACGEDAGLRQRVDGLLRAYQKAGAFLEEEAGGPMRNAERGMRNGEGGGRSEDGQQPGGTIAVVPPLTEKPGDKVGHYKLLEQIGEGGCGAVYMAEQQEPIRRKVAFKVIKLGMDTKQVIARFEAERQALALMDHPNIAKVLDAGTTETGRPYFVMELVRGQRITEYCDANNLATEQRLSLFMQVCHAIQHAHQKGIIHRDIKPSNILVTVVDGEPVPKVIDFGIAKAIGQQLTEKTVFTSFEQFIGTPAYMSPEQAMLSGVDVDTRSDIYSLGVLLYELLTGYTPFDPKTLLSAGLDEMRRIIREQEPARPSTRLSRLDASEQTTVAKRRQAEPPRLIHQVRGDLDWIVMKCLEKHRARRYETVNGVAADLERHLKHEPVTAAAPSARYRLEKFVRRNKAALATAMALALLLAIGVVVSTWQAVRATRAKAAALAESKRADRQALVAKRVTTYMQRILDTAHPSSSKGPDYKVRELLDDFSKTIDAELLNEPEVAAELHETVGAAYDGLYEHEKAGQHFSRALELRRTLFGAQHEKCADILVRSALNLPLWATKADQGKAEATLREALQIYRARGVEGQPVIHTLWALHAILDGEGKAKEIVAVVEEAEAEARKTPGTNYWELLGMKNGLVKAKILQGKLTEAEQIGREAVAEATRLHGPEFTLTSWAQLALGAALTAQGKFAEAITSQKQALASMRKFLTPDHEALGLAKGRILNTLEQAHHAHALTNAVASAAELAELEPLFHERLTSPPRLAGNDSDPTIVSRNGLAQFPSFYLELGNELTAAGKTNAATECRQRFLALLQAPDVEQAVEPDLLARLCLDNLSVSAETGELNTAKQLRNKLLTLQPKDGALLNEAAWLLATYPEPDLRNATGAVSFAEKAVAARSRKEPMYLDTLAAAYAEAGQFTNAVAAQQEAITLLQDEAQKKDYASRLSLYERNCPYHDDGILAQRVSRLLAAGRFAEAEPAARECLRIREAGIPDDWQTFNCRSMLGHSLLGQKKYAEAEPCLLSGYEGMKQREGKIPDVGKLRLKQALWGLVQLYEETGQAGQAADWKRTLNQVEREGLRIPPRDPQAKASLIDLSTFYNAGFRANWHSDVLENNLAELPVGVHTLAGVTFDLRGLIQVGFSRPEAAINYPKAISGIPIGQNCRRLHFLQAAMDAAKAGPDKRIGRYVVRYADGHVEEIPLVLGVDLDDWWEQECNGKSYAVAWAGSNGKAKRFKLHIHLFRRTWENPRPEAVILSLDFESTHTQAYPFLVAVTAD